LERKVETMIRISKHLETAIITITVAVIVILSNIIWAPDFSVNAATMQYPEGIYLNQAFVDAGAGSRTETLEEWQAFLTSNADSDYYLGAGGDAGFAVEFDGTGFRRDDVCWNAVP
jgi:hypothetical protein